MNSTFVRVYTVGHSSRTAARLAEILLDAGIELVVDVRRFPSSQRFPQFQREALSAFLSEMGVDYVHEEHLGGHRRPSSDPDFAALEEGLRGYAAHMLRPHFDEAVGRLLAHARRRATAILCAEADFHACHRRLLSDYLVVRGVEVIHLGRQGRRVRHELDPRARVGPGRRLSYPRREGSQLELF